MLALWVKPEERERLLKAIEVDADSSERDEPGCLRFNVLQGRAGPERLLLLRSLPGRGRAGGASGDAPFCRLARGRGYAGRRAPGNA
jgi:antibiotic biosynthesis monooxygenase